MRTPGLIATTFLLLAALAACGGVGVPVSDPVREEIAVRTADGRTHDFERALTTVARVRR